jgi:hypothetical protein
VDLYNSKFNRVWKRTSNIKDYIRSDRYPWHRQPYLSNRFRSVFGASHFFWSKDLFCEVSWHSVLRLPCWNGFFLHFSIWLVTMVASDILREKKIVGDCTCRDAYYTIEIKIHNKKKREKHYVFQLSWKGGGGCFKYMKT